MNRDDTATASSPAREPAMTPWRLKVPLFVSAAAWLCSCSWITGVDTRDYRIRVDSIAAPARASAGDTLRFVLHGTVGPDGCHKLERIDEYRSLNSVELVVWGQEKTGNVGCTLAVIELHHAYAVAPPLGDPFSIIVLQPDGSRLVRSLPVD